MADTVSPERRSQIMSRIRGSNTRPELAIRKGLHARGLRFRLYRKDLPGSPDLVLSRYRTVVFVHGCFWHGHDCSLFRLPRTNPEFWRTKIDANRARDHRASVALQEAGWKVLYVWECSIRGKSELALSELLDELAQEIKKEQD